MTEPNISHKSDINQPIDSSLDYFYADILSKGFSSSVEAIDYCRKLCATYGFTIKQEQSTYRNIYVYCSREGFPDSLRNPKSNPKRRRPSKRCDCRWRVVLNENNGVWEFRKSLNPEASKHNHELMRPEEIEKGWPKEMLDLICELARQRLPTPEIRSRVQLVYTHIPWNERRFYNRLSEERQKIRIRDAESRVQQLNGLWSNMIAVAAGSQLLTEVVQTDINKIVDKLCSMTQTDPSTLLPPLTQEQEQEQQQQQQQRQQQQQEQQQQQQQNNDDDDNYHSSSPQDTMDTTGDSSQDETNKPPSTTRKQSNKSGGSDAPKGFTAVTVPRQVYYIKLHAHRVLQDVQQLQRRRSRSLAFSEELPEIGDDASVSISNQQKKQKTPSLMNLSQHQQQQLHQSDLSSSLSLRQLDPQGHLPPHDHSSPGYLYSSSSYREPSYFTSTLYPVYPPPPGPAALPPASASSRYMTQHPAMTMYATGRPPPPPTPHPSQVSRPLTNTLDDQQQQQQHHHHQQQQQQHHHHSSSIQMTSPPSTSSASSSPHTLRLSTPHTSLSMMSTTVGSTITTSPKDPMMHMPDMSSNLAGTPQPSAPPPSHPSNFIPLSHHPSYSLQHSSQQQASLPPPPPPPPSQQQQQQQQHQHHQHQQHQQHQQQQNEQPSHYHHHHEQQRMYYPSLPNHVFPSQPNSNNTSTSNSNHTNSGNTNTNNSVSQQGMYYMDTPSSSRMPPSQ